MIINCVSLSSAVGAEVIIAGVPASAFPAEQREVTVFI